MSSAIPTVSLRTEPRAKKCVRILPSATVAAVAAVTWALNGMGGSAAADDSLIAIAGPARGPHAGLLQAIIAGAADGLRAPGDGPKADSRAPPRMVIEDDGCRPETAKGAAEALVALKPALVIGHPCPAAAIAAAPIYAAAGIPFLAIGVRHPDLTDRRAGPSIFRLAGRDDRQGEAAARTLLASAPGRRIAIIQDRTAYARAISGSTVAALEQLGVVSATVLPIVAGRRQYEAEIAKLAEMNVEATLFAGYPSEAAVILRGMRRAGIKGLLLGSDANATADFANAVREIDGSDRVAVLMPAIVNKSFSERELAAARSPEPPRDANISPAHPLRVLAMAAAEIWLQSRDDVAASDPSSAGQSAATPSVAPPLAAIIGARHHATSALGEISFDQRGDARVPSFAAATLVDGEWQIDLTTAAEHVSAKSRVQAVVPVGDGRPRSTP